MNCGRAGFCFAVLLLLLSFVCIPGESKQPKQPFEEKLFSAALIRVSDNPILIIDDSNFTDLGFPGSGTGDDPYVISNLEFSTSGTAITIIETVSYFVIRDCTFSRDSPENNSFGVSFQMVRNGRVENCTFSSLDIGIILDASVNCRITRCEIRDSWDPIILEASSYCLVSRNHIEGGGVSVFDSVNCQLESNVMRSRQDGGGNGVHVSESGSIILHNNTISNFTWGVGLFESWDSTIINNTLLDNGLFFDSLEKYDYNATVENCTVNGKNLGYFNNLEDAWLDGTDYGQLILFDCRNVSIEGGEFNRASVGVLMTYSGHCHISSFTSSQNHYGVQVRNSSNCTLTDAVIAQNWAGIRLLNGSRRIQLLDSLVSDNTGNGILIINGYECRIIGNEILENGGIGLQVKSAWGHEIYYNTFGGNIDYNAFDWGTGSSWDDGVSCGNYWDDLVPGAVYVIPGEGAIDHYPNGTAGTFTPTPPFYPGNSSWILPDELLPLTIAGFVSFLIVAIVITKRRGAV
ncbi:MAG: right-handed parallel beta-helix repeat-containing protein [Candidatus Thorarchaeota archaeon]|nr:MAG: right-handed parallel beta-helix repeat-containing protein [Candidatus Thorarchaeota archaeon]